jgi:hypothetical protein
MRHVQHISAILGLQFLFFGIDGLEKTLKTFDATIISHNPMKKQIALGFAQDVGGAYLT